MNRRQFVRTTVGATLRWTGAGASAFFMNFAWTSLSRLRRRRCAGRSGNAKLCEELVLPRWRADAEEARVFFGSVGGVVRRVGREHVTGPGYRLELRWRLAGG